MRLSQENKEFIRQSVLEQGFECCGFAVAGPVSAEASKRYDDWIAAGKQSTMAYLEKYRDIKNDPRLLLEGAKTVIAVAVNYLPKNFQAPEAPQFAYYAYGKDYHEVIRDRLRPVAQLMHEKFGCENRICVDTAPLRERYWAQQAGIGFVGRNNQIIIPNKGSYFLLGFIITTAEIEPDEPCTLNCLGCRRCIIYCPSGALKEEGACDARLCHSCLSIEYRGELDEKVRFGRQIYGCDICLRVCPHNHNAQPTEIEEFQPSEEFMALRREDIEQMSTEDYNRIFRHSAIKRAKLAQLKRNMEHMDKPCPPVVKSSD